MDLAGIFKLSAYQKNDTRRRIERKKTGGIFL
jgi:hypothetical protein